MPLFLKEEKTLIQLKHYISFIDFAYTLLVKSMFTNFVRDTCQSL